MDKQARAELYQALLLVVPKGDILTDVPMSRYTSLRLGGPAEMLVEISEAAQAAQVLRIAARRQIPVHILGNGSNILVRDGGLPGLTLHIGDHFSNITTPVTDDGTWYTLTAEAGAAMTALANAAADGGLTGLEFAAGIPGTVGGCVRMNAGAYGGEIGGVVTQVDCVTREGEAVSYTKEEMDFSYRHSRINGEVLLSATIMLRNGDEDAVRVAMRELNARRRDKQPLTLPCCGSTFKRPPGQFAGKLIEECGLKGSRIGGAAVSEKHAGFLVNDEGGTALDYIRLMEHVQQVVKQKTGIWLEPEVQIIGIDPEQPN